MMHDDLLWRLKAYLTINLAGGLALLAWTVMR